MSNESSILMAQRLKDLRKEKNISHVSLSNAIKEKYGIEISRDSLMSYEVSDPNHTKAYKNEGMRVEYLRCLADFYGVSSDYLLGLTDDPKRQPSAVDSLGFSPEAINMIQIEKSTPFGSKYMPGLNLLIETQTFASILRSIADLEEFIESISTNNTYSFLSDDDKRPVDTRSFSDSYTEYDKTHWNDQLAKSKLEDTIFEAFPELKGRLTVLCGFDNIEYLINQISQSFSLVVKRAVHFDKYELSLIRRKSHK